MFCEYDFIGMTLDELDWLLCCMENNYNGGHCGDIIEYGESITYLKTIVNLLWEADEYLFALEELF